MFIKVKKVYIPRIERQETKRQEIKMNKIYWNWSDNDEMFTFVALNLLHIRRSNKIYMYLMICDCLGKMSYFLHNIF